MSDMIALEQQVREATHALKMVLNDHRFSLETQNTIWSQLDWAVDRFFDEREKAGKRKS